MLAQTIVLIAAFAIVAASVVSGIAGGARAGAAEAAKALIAPGIETALGRYQHYVAATIAAQIEAPAGPLTAPPGAVPALNAATPWREISYLDAGPVPPLQVAVDVRPTAQTVPSCTSGASGPDVARQLQCSPFVQESRLSLALTAVAGPAGDDGVTSPLAQSRSTVTLRLFAQPPYAIVSGVEDAADPAGYHEGDTGGWAGALPAFATPGPTADDTTIHVLYRCTGGSGSCAFSAPPPLDDPTSVPWTNGNGLP